MLDNSIPDVLVELQRDDYGRVVKFAYTVNNAGEDGRRTLEACALLDTLFGTEGPEGLHVNLDAHIDILPAS